MIGYSVEDKIGNICIEIKEKGEVGIRPYLEIGDINIKSKDYSFKNKASIKGCKLVKKGDILISRVRPTRGAIVVVKEEELCVSNAFTILRPVQPISSSIVWYYLAWNQHYLSYLGENCTGTLYPTVSDVTIVDYPFPILPLNEQKRIVAKLDAILPKVKSAKVRLEKIPGILKKFRQSVLASACSGRLTEDWRVGKDLPEWTETTIREIAISMSTGPFGTMLHSYDYIENGIPVINPTNIIDDEIIPDNSVTLKQEKAIELYRYRLQANDILLARRGDLSKCGIVTEKEVNWIAGTGLFILRVNNNPKYFKYLFATGAIQSILNNNSIGSTMLNLNQTILGNIELLLPPLPEQNEIVRCVEKLFALADSLEAKYKKAMAKVEKLEQAILAKAFRGELVDPDPNDEPAEELLKRILAEKAKLDAGKKTSRKK